MDLTSGIAVRLAALCLQDNGRLRDFAVWDVAARGALLVDLARVARLTEEEDGIDVDGTPTGFEPADRLLAAIAVEPEQSLDWWQDHGGVRMRDVAEAAVATGRWTGQRTLFGRRYSVRSTADGGTSDSDAAAVRVLAIASGAHGNWPEPVDEADLVPTGDLRWICAAVTEHLRRAHRRNLLSAGAADGGSSPYF